jgi:hypothetical protein
VKEDTCLLELQTVEANRDAWAQGGREWSPWWSSRFGFWLTVSMRWDYVSELRLPAGLLFILPRIYEHREPWLSDVDRGKLLIRPPECSLAILPCNRKIGGTGKINEFCLTKYIFHNSKDSLKCRKILRHGASGFTFLPKEGVLQIIMSIKNSSLSTVFEPAKFGFSRKHNNH